MTLPISIQVTVRVNAKSPAVEKIDERHFKIYVNAPAHEGKANKRLQEILAEYFNVSKSSVTIKKGMKSRHKIIEIK